MKTFWGNKRSLVATRIMCTAAAVADPENFGGGGILSTKPQKFGCLHQNWEWFFGRNRKFERFFRPKSGVLQKKKKKKKKVFTKIESDFSAGFVTFRLVGGDASRNGAELFEIEADFSAKIVTFRLVGGDASPPSPPLNPPLCCWEILS